MKHGQESPSVLQMPQTLAAAAVATPPPQLRLSKLLSSTSNVSTAQLAEMAAQAYMGSVELISLKALGPWTPRSQYFDPIVPAVYYQHNSTGTGILSFRGVLDDVSGCISAKYKFNGTAAGPTWFETCRGSGPEAFLQAQLSIVAKQTAALIASHPRVSLLTGHSLGCYTAMAAGRIARLPVVCYDAPGSFGTAWLSSYPGLQETIATERQLPTNIFTLQAFSDPLSNCLLPRLGDDPRRVWGATTCSFAPPPPGCSPGFSELSYDVSSDCVAQSHYMQNMRTVPAELTLCSDRVEESVAVCPALTAGTASRLGSAFRFGNRDLDRVRGVVGTWGSTKHQHAIPVAPAAFWGGEVGGDIPEPPVANPSPGPVVNVPHAADSDGAHA